MSYKIKIIDIKKDEPVRHSVLRVVGRNVRGVPCKFELVEDEQTVDVSSNQEVFVAVILPVKMFEGNL